MTRLGLTVPLAGVPVAELGDVYALAARYGYTDLWSGEVAGADGFTPLALAAAVGPDLRLGTGVVSVFTRGPALLALSFAALASAAPGRVVAGIGASSATVVAGWNGIEYTRPWYRVRDTVRFLRHAFTGEKVTARYETFAVEGFRLDTPPPVTPPIHVAALREGMLRLAAREADGVILNWLSADDVDRVGAVVHDAGDDCEIVARLFVCPSEDEQTVRAHARRHIAAYLNVPAYADFHRWLGRGPELEDMWNAWQSGDRAGALRQISNDLIDQLIIHGSAEHCWRQVRRYVEAGVTTPVVCLMPWGVSEGEALRRLGK